MNNDKEIKTILSLGSSKIYTIDPQQKDQITKTTIDTLVKDARTHMNRKKRVHFVLIKE